MSGYTRRGDSSKRARNWASYGAMTVVLLIASLTGTGCHSLPVSSYPPGARVFMNSKDTGLITPTAIRVRHLPVGRTVITVAKEGYFSVPSEQEVNVGISKGNIIFSWWPPVLIKNLCGDRWKGITSPRGRRLNEFRLQTAVEMASSQSQDVGGQSQKAIPSVVGVAGKPDRDVVPRNVAPASNPRLKISAHIEDDPARGETILGNNDGRVQRGESFDLVVVIANEGQTVAADVTCKITLPIDGSLKAYTELYYTVAEMVPATATTNRVNLMMPVGATIEKAPKCMIEVKEAGAQTAEWKLYSLPFALQ